MIRKKMTDILKMSVVFYYFRPILSAAYLCPSRLSIITGGTPPAPLRSRSVSAPTVLRLFNGFCRRKVGGDTEEVRIISVLTLLCGMPQAFLVVV